MGHEVANEAKEKLVLILLPSGKDRKGPTVGALHICRYEPGL